MLIPSRALLALLIVLALLAVGASVWTAFAPAWIGLAGLALILLALDGAQALRASLPVATRQVPHAWALGAEREVSVWLEHAQARPLAVRMFDHVPADFEARALPLAAQLPPGERVRLPYRTRALARGDRLFGLTELRIESPLKLWERRAFVGAESRVKVYPNFAALTRYALFATDNRLSQIGVLRRRRRGLGLDFQHLREYREGDAQRQIDWKATSRMGRLISRQYQDERDQQILLLVDCGRRMSSRDTTVDAAAAAAAAERALDGAPVAETFGLTHLDHVLNAALLLAYVGLRQGDAVGLATLAGDPRWFAPRKSLGTVNQLMNQVYDLEPTPASPDFHSAAVGLMARLRKRALVVILTNLRDEDDDTLAPAVALLRQRHLVLVASLREPILANALREPVATLDDALTHAATAEYLQRRTSAFARLEAARIPCIDVEPAALALALVNRYMDLKRSGRL